MPESSLLGALPIGLLLFLGMYVGMRRRRLGSQRAARTFPALADELGLVHRPGGHAGTIGTLGGEWHGRRIFVDPDERMRIFVGFRRSVRIDLRTYSIVPAPRTMTALHIGRGDFATLFPHRYASEEFADALRRDATQLNTAARPLRDLRAGRLKELAVTEEGAECIFDFGRPAHLPPAIVKQTLPLVHTLLNALEEAAEPPQGSAGSRLSST